MNAGNVLILGGGINGAAVARELAVNGVGVELVERADLCTGATAFSSRLIHGGLRYLEYGEFALVRESLAERTRLLRVAPQFVRPLELYLPSTNRFGGLVASVERMIGLERYARAPKRGRGAWLIRVGLTFYDVYSHDPKLPKHRSLATAAGEGMPFDPARYPWQSAYFDAQIRYPERFVIALLEDAQDAARQFGVACEIRTHHQARLRGKTAEIVDSAGNVVHAFEPALIINATGAWVDRTLETLSIRTPRPLMGGTKGTHLITAHFGLRQTLAGRGIYAEASDGRPVFILPFGGGTLIGTTDEPFPGDPSEAIATDPEIDYLLDAVNTLLPQCALTRDDLEMHYCGVRPLPAVDASRPAAVTRRHSIDELPGCDPPVLALIGGKLTTCRSLAEEAGDLVLKRLGRPRAGSTRDRPLPGAPSAVPPEGAWPSALSAAAIASIEQLRGFPPESARAAAASDPRPLAGFDLPRGYVRWTIENEWVATLSDLVERRLMLLFEPALSRETLSELARLLVEAGRISASAADAEVDAVVADLARRYGKRVKDRPAR